MEELRAGSTAVLNIRNFPDALHKKLRARAKRQHRSVAQEVTHLLNDAVETADPVSILELRGLDKDRWREIDAASHVRRERASWD
jgi:plasmid stability protein